MYEHTHTQTHTRVHVCTWYLCLSVLIDIDTDIDMCVFVCVCAYIRTFTHGVLNGDPIVSNLCLSLSYTGTLRSYVKRSLN